MHPAFEVELRACEVAEIAVGKYAELEYRYQRHLHPARHTHRRPGGTNRRNLQSDGNNLRGQPRIGARTDNAGSVLRTAIGVCLCPLDALQIRHASDLSAGWRRSLRQRIQIALG